MGMLQGFSLGLPHFNSFWSSSLTKKHRVWSFTDSAVNHLQALKVMDAFRSNSSDIQPLVVPKRIPPLGLGARRTGVGWSWILLAVETCIIRSSMSSTFPSRKATADIADTETLNCCVIPPWHHQENPCNLWNLQKQEWESEGGPGGGVSP